ncbi:hypothetical protein GGI20_005700 [Coemansia sp. BCRC 34301]|nr:hypothetical protein GGI20_005700 [Coemansia sp. BCRC 34301]
MFVNGAVDNINNSQAIRANQLIDRARQAEALDQQDYVELQRIMEDLLESVFSSGTPFSSQTSAGVAEAGLYLVGELLSSPSISRLYECGIRSAAHILSVMPAAIASISSQGGNEASSVYNLQITDVCLSKLAKAIDELARQLERSVATPSANEAGGAAELLQLATVCAECTGNAVERLSAAGEDGLLKSPAIWKSALDGTSAVALHIYKIFEAGCRFLTLCANQELRRQPQCSVLYKASEKLTILSSAVFGSKSHLTHEAGMKRSLLLRYCERTLGVHRAMLNSAPLFRAVWQSLCSIVTTFPMGASSDGAGLCLKVYLQSCDTARYLATQLAAFLRQTASSEMRDPKVEQRVTKFVAFIKFIVFQLPAILTRIRTIEAAGRGADSNAAVTAAVLSTVDIILGELACGQTLCRTSPKATTLIRQIVDTFITKLLTTLFTSYLAPITNYLDSLRSFVGGNVDATTAQIPLLPGVQCVAANREILVIIASSIGAFSDDQQQALLTRGVGLIRAIALSVDRDIVSALPYAMADAGEVCADQMSSVTESEKLVQAVAVCATKVASPAIFGHWEVGALAAVTQSPPCSLGAWVVAEAWILLAKHVLTSQLVMSTVIGIIEARVSDTSTNSVVVCRLVSGLATTRCDGERVQLLSDINQRFLRPNDAARVASACVLVPWLAFDAPDVVCTMAKQMVVLLSKGPSPSRDISVSAALAALAPAIAKQKVVDRTLVSNICNSAYTVLERCCVAQGSDAASSRVAEELLSAVSQLPIGSSEHARRLLELCARNLGCSALSGSWALVRLSEFIGVFITADLAQPSASTVVQWMGQVTAHLLDAQRPWIVQHAAHLLIVRFATESATASVIESLVPGHMQAGLVDFIQCVPAGAPLDGDNVGDRRRKLYRDIFGHFALASDSLRVDDAESQSLVDAIRVLCGRLDGATCDVAVQSELARLAQTIERVRRR